MNPWDFFNKYELLASSDSLNDVGEKASVCRYCGKNDSQTTFHQDTHLIPEFLGSNKTRTFDECDSCNQLFGVYESNMAVFFRPYLTLLGVRGKRGTPKFQSRTIDRNESTRTRIEITDEWQREVKMGEVDDFRIDKENKHFELLFRKEPFSPLKVYKGLVKIGMSLLPQKFDQFNRQTFRWLINESDEPIGYCRSGFAFTVKKKAFTNPRAHLYRAKRFKDENRQYPEHVLVLCFANQVFQIFLPFSEESDYNPSKTFELNLFPGFVYNQIENLEKLKVRQYDLGVEEKVTENHSVHFSYGEYQAHYNSTDI